MLFNSIAFLLFFPIFLIVFFNLHGKYRLLFTLASSYLFYGWWDYRFLFLIILSTMVNFYFGVLCNRIINKNSLKLVLWANLVFNLGMLAIFKYLNFFIDSFYKTFTLLGLKADVPTLNIILPVGISFFTFQGLSYVLDVYWGKIKPEKKFLNLAVYISLFPQLVAGPIVRASDFLPQLRKDSKFSNSRFFKGFELMLFGYFQKVVIADSIAPVVDRLLASPGNETSISLLFGVFLFSFQIYCDFSGYSLIAIGCGRIMGYDFGVNFNRPYLARDFSDFWRRWHISLSSWLRDYLYIPLGGNRKGSKRTSINLLLTMLLGGLWHGASWNFVVWGGLHGFFLIFQRFFKHIEIKENNYIFIILKIFIVNILVCFTWIFFRADSFEYALSIISNIVDFDGLSILNVPSKFLVLKALILILCLFIIEIYNEFFYNKKHNMIINSFSSKILRASFILLLILVMGTFNGNSFVYFQF